MLLRLAVVLVCAGCCWMEGTNQDEQAQRPIMMRAPKTYERAWTGKSARHCSCLGARGPEGRRKLKLKHVGWPAVGAVGESTSRSWAEEGTRGARSTEGATRVGSSRRRRETLLQSGNNIGLLLLLRKTCGRELAGAAIGNRLLVPAVCSKDEMTARRESKMQQQQQLLSLLSLLLVDCTPSIIYVPSITSSHLYTNAMLLHLSCVAAKEATLHRSSLLGATTACLPA